MDPVPRATTLDEVEGRSGYQAVQPPGRPPYWGIDRDPARRPGVPRMREPQPWPNTRFPPERQLGSSAVPKHGRPNKPFPPVFGTSCPPRGLSGAIRKLAYGLPDHYPTHWLLLLLGDRVESWGTRARRALPVALPVAILAIVVRRALA
ncbi:MAG: hypothetical protein ACJ79H_11785 [Myxococcales bacterium]